MSKTVECKIGEIFGEIKNRIQSGYNLREIIDHIDELRFAAIYESKLAALGELKKALLHRAFAGEL